MDNASEALLIAGGILLAILTITALVVMFSNAATIQNAQNNKEELERLAKWNAEWEAYNKKYLYGAEVLTVVKKAEQNNKESSNNNYVYPDVIDVAGNLIVVANYTNMVEIKNYLSNIKTNIFECTKIEYDADTGRVNRMEFKFKE